MSIDSSKYVVLDVETNGLTVDNDLLSISIYMPDKDKRYERYLPLELNKSINPEASKVNGITIDMIQDKSPMTQQEYDELKEEYELEDREILHFGKIDPTFIKHYFLRHGIDGFDRLVFHNIKRHFLTNTFSNGEYSKDNLCKGFGIEGVTDVHSGINDCILEWKLFEKTDGGFVLCQRIGGFQIGLYKLTSNYYIPASKIRSFPNMKYAVDLPKVRVDYEEIFRLSLSDDCRHNKNEFFQPAGFASERILRAMLNAKMVDDNNFAQENFKKLIYLGKFAFMDLDYEIPVTENADGTLTAIREEDRGFVEETNRVMLCIKKELSPLVEFVKNDIFKNKEILTQELVVSDKLRAFGYADFSNEEACLEMKFSESLLWDVGTPNHPAIDKHKYQFYILSNNRPTYLLIGAFGSFVVLKMTFHTGEDYTRVRVSGERAPYVTRRVLQYTADGELVKVHKSTFAAADALKISVKAIRENCAGRHKLSSGFQFKYEGSEKEISKVIYKIPSHGERRESVSIQTKHVLQFDLEGNFIKEFESVKQACEETGASPSKISMVCSGQRKHTKGFVWKYKNQD